MGTHMAGVARRQDVKMGVKIMVDGEYSSEDSLLRGDRRAGVEWLVVKVSGQSDQPPEFVARILKEAAYRRQGLLPSVSSS
jgi:hypothetical protein